MAETPFIKDIRTGGTQHELLLAVVYSIYRTVREQDRWPLILKQIQELLSARACCLAIQDFQRRTGKIVIHSGCFDDQYLALYDQTYSRLDPWLRHEEHYRTMDVSWVGDELVSRSQLVGTDFHHEWLMPQDLMHQCSGILFRDREHLIYLRSYRSPDQPAFSRHELYPLQRLLPHLRQTLELHSMVASKQVAHFIPMEQFVEHLGASDGIIEAQQQLMAVRDQPEEFTISLPQAPTAVTKPTVESAGASLAAKNDEPDNQDSQDLIDTLLLDVAESASPMDETDEAEPIGHMIAVPARAPEPGRTQGRRWLPLLFNTTHEEPNKESSEETGESVETAPIDTLESCSDEPAVEAAEKRLKQLYNLTPSEAKLAELLASGCDLPRAAWRLDIGLNTVRTHLQRIYSKTDTHHQSELVALLLAGPAQLRVDYYRAGEDDDDFETQGSRSSSTRDSRS